VRLKGGETSPTTSPGSLGGDLGTCGVKGGETSPTTSLGSSGGDLGTCGVKEGETSPTTSLGSSGGDLGTDASSVATTIVQSCDLFNVQNCSAFT
jgi:hypothetical protein